MTDHVPIPPDVEAAVTACIGAAIAVHRELGPGYREVIYRKAYCLELDSRGLRFECEKPSPSLLDFLPHGLHFRQCGVVHRSPLRFEDALQRREATAELLVRLPQR